MKSINALLAAVASVALVAGAGGVFAQTTTKSPTSENLPEAGAPAAKIQGKGATELPKGKAGTAQAPSKTEMDTSKSNPQVGGQPSEAKTKQPPMPAGGKTTAEPKAKPGENVPQVGGQPAAK